MKKISIIVERVFAIAFFVAGIGLIIAGLFCFDKLVWGHVIWGFVAFVGGIALFFFAETQTCPDYDELTHRFYHYAEKTDNPHHANCPRCGELSRMIITTSNKHHYGVYCEACRREVWFDKEKK